MSAYRGMTVEELIQDLSELPPHHTVQVLSNGWYGTTYVPAQQAQQGPGCTVRISG